MRMLLDAVSSLISHTRLKAASFLSRFLRYRAYFKFALFDEYEGKEKGRVMPNSNSRSIRNNECFQDEL